LSLGLVIGALAATATAAAGLHFEPAEPRLGDLVVVRAPNLEVGAAAAELHAFGYAFDALPDPDGGLVGFLATPVDGTPGPSPVHLVLGGARVATATVTLRGRAFEQSELRVSRRFTKKKPKALRRRIARESKAIAAIWARPPTPARRLGAPRSPTQSETTSPFGVERVFNGKLQSRHYGLDLDGRTGDPVAAVLPGRVVMSAMRFYSGGTLVLDHGGGLFSLYFHLSRRRVKVGREVEAGQRIGDVGRSGRVTGPHLHLAVVVRARWLEGPRAGKTRGLYVDPESLLAWGAR